jgi:hypothetical protein
MLDHNNNIHYGYEDEYIFSSFIRDPIAEDELFQDEVDENDVDESLLICPLSKDIMMDPIEVVDINGFSIIYDRNIILNWVKEHKTCPSTTCEIKEMQYASKLRRVIHKKYPNIREKLKTQIEIEMMLTTYEYIPYLKTEQAKILAVNGNGLFLKYINEQTEKICFVAVNNNMEAVEYVKDINTKEYLLKFIEYQNYRDNMIKPSFSCRIPSNYGEIGRLVEDIYSEDDDIQDESNNVIIPGNIGEFNVNNMIVPGTIRFSEYNNSNRWGMYTTRSTLADDRPSWMVPVERMPSVLLEELVNFQINEENSQIHSLTPIIGRMNRIAGEHPEEITNLSLDEENNDIQESIHITQPPSIIYTGNIMERSQNNTIIIPSEHSDETRTIYGGYITISAENNIILSTHSNNPLATIIICSENEIKIMTNELSIRSNSIEIIANNIKIEGALSITGNVEINGHTINEELLNTIDC